MKKYKFRAECVQDAFNFLLIPTVLGIKSIKIKRKILNFFTPDVEVTIKTAMPITEIIETMRKVENSHVMIQTLQPIEQYTGERNYELN